MKMNTQYKNWGENKTTKRKPPCRFGWIHLFQNELPSLHVSVKAVWLVFVLLVFFCCCCSVLCFFKACRFLVLLSYSHRIIHSQMSHAVAEFLLHLRFIQGKRRFLVCLACGWTAGLCSQRDVLCFGISLFEGLIAGTSFFHWIY